MENKRQVMQQFMDCILKVRHNDLEKVKEQSELLLKMAIKEKDSYCIAFAFTYLGEYYITESDSLKCGSYLLTARRICMENEYKELLMKACYILGINYQYAQDEQMSFQYNLEALELARFLGDKITESVILNNIGVMFQQRKDLEEAKSHYLSAYEILEDDVNHLNSHLYGTLLVNLSEVYCLSGEPERALSYIHQLDQKGYDEIFVDMIIKNEYHRYAAATGNNTQLFETADFLLSNYSKNPKEKFSSFDIIVHVCENMLNLKNKEYSQKAIELLNQLSDDKITERARMLQKLKIRYFETFGEEEEMVKAYACYYKIAETLEQQNNHIVVSGLKAKIRLNKVIKERDVIQKLNEDLESVVHIDELTHLYNRRYFNGIIQKYKNNNKAKNIGFIMLDVDYFKEYNDYYGHQDGDCVLQAVADCLKSWTYRQLYPCRYGGDEFACLCINMTDEQIENYIINVQNQLAHHSIEHIKSSCGNYITLSIGYCNTIYCDDVDALLETADQALYEAKAKGRNCFTKKEFTEESKCETLPLF